MRKEIVYARKITLLKDGEWSLIDGEFCRVIDFVPIGSSVKNGKVVTMDITTPYASLQLECKKISGEITGFITHKVDFVNLWKVFREREVREDEEVLIIWSTKHYKSKIFKAFSRIMPKLWVMIWPKRAFEVLNNLNSNTKFSDEIIWDKLKTGPIVEFKPDVMDQFKRGKKVRSWLRRIAPIDETFSGSRLRAGVKSSGFIFIPEGIDIYSPMKIYYDDDWTTFLVPKEERKKPDIEDRIKSLESERIELEKKIIELKERINEIDRELDELREQRKTG